jgi:hypothetical protein
MRPGLMTRIGMAIRDPSFPIVGWSASVAACTFMSGFALGYGGAKSFVPMAGATAISCFRLSQALRDAENVPPNNGNSQ